LIKDIYKIKVNISSKVSRVYIGPLIRHRFRYKREYRYKRLESPIAIVIVVTMFYAPGVTTALRDAGYYSSLFSLIRSKASSLCPNAYSHLRA
jgi:hypothetical protein